MTHPCTLEEAQEAKRKLDSFLAAFKPGSAAKKETPTKRVREEESWPNGSTVQLIHEHVLRSGTITSNEASGPGKWVSVKLDGTSTVVKVHFAQLMRAKPAGGEQRAQPLERALVKTPMQPPTIKIGAQVPRGAGALDYTHSELTAPATIVFPSVLSEDDDDYTSVSTPVNTASVSTPVKAASATAPRRGAEVLHVVMLSDDDSTSL